MVGRCSPSIPLVPAGTVQRELPERTLGDWYGCPGATTDAADLGRPAEPACVQEQHEGPVAGKGPRDPMRTLALDQDAVIERGGGDG